MSDFRNSKTKDNLMRAFAGESQARNRYTMAEEKARQQKLYVLADLFKFTADQEKVHAKIFYEHLKELSGESVFVDGGYPVDISEDMCTLLGMADHNERQESDDVYPAFAEVARQEGYGKIAQDFTNIAKIENVHGKRFAAFGKLKKEGKLFSSSQSETWVCLNCGYIVEGTQAPERCPVCGEAQGYYIRLSMASWGVIVTVINSEVCGAAENAVPHLYVNLGFWRIGYHANLDNLTNLGSSPVSFTHSTL